MNKSGDIIVIDNKTGIDLDKLPSAQCAFVCSNETVPSDACYDSAAEKLEYLWNKGYRYFFVEWGSCYGDFALKALADIRKIESYKLKIIAVHVIGRRNGQNANIMELINVFNCDGIAYAYTQTGLVRGLVSKCSAVVTENNIMYPLV